MENWDVYLTSRYTQIFSEISIDFPASVMAPFSESRPEFCRSYSKDKYEKDGIPRAIDPLRHCVLPRRSPPNLFQCNKSPQKICQLICLAVTVQSTTYLLEEMWADSTDHVQVYCSVFRMVTYKINSICFTIGLYVVQPNSFYDLGLGEDVRKRA